MTLRPATEDDLPFVLMLQDKPRMEEFIGSDTVDGYRDYMAAPDAHLMISDATRGFALFMGPNASEVLFLQRMVIDAPGAGLGKTFLTEIIEFAFDTIGTHRLYLDAISTNTRARRAYERAGFVQEGMLRQNWRCRTGELVDQAVYAMLRAERP